MYSLVAKRIIRGRGLFLAFFLSVTLAATLFSGIILGSDAVAVSLTSDAFKKAKYDVLLVTGEGVKNATKTQIWDADPIFEAIPGVVHADHFLTMLNMQVVDVDANKTLPCWLVAIPDGSELYQGIRGVTKLEDGLVYVDASSFNATSIPQGSPIRIRFQTYNPFGGVSDFAFREYPFKAGASVALDDQTYSLVVNQYNRYLSAALGGSDTVGGRPPLNILVASQATVKGIHDALYREGRRPVKDLLGVVAIRLDRARLVNTWDASGSINRIAPIVQQLNAKGAQLYFSPRNYLTDIINAVLLNSNTMKLNSVLITLPVFFTAWYLGSTISELSLGLRRKEIGLLLTRGLTHRQVLLSLLAEAVFIGLVGGAAGILVGCALIPYVIPGIDVMLAFQSISLTNIGFSLAFSLVLSLLAAVRPARRATKLEVIEALSEYRQEEEELGTWHEPLLAVFFGGYKLAMLLLQIDIEAFRPSQADFLTYLLYNTWWGLDKMLSLVWMILLFWGVTRLFIIYVPWFPRLLGSFASALVGDVSHFTALSSRRNLKRTMAYTFMATLIIAYSFQVVGGVSSSSSYTERVIETQISGDMAVVLFNRNDAAVVSEGIKKIDGVSSTAVEVEFEAQSSLGVIPVRAIDSDDWAKTAYTDRLLVDNGALSSMKAQMDQILADLEKDPLKPHTLYVGVLDRQLSRPLGARADGISAMNIRVNARVYTVRVAGFFGRDMGENWGIQQPALYMPSKFLERVADNEVVGVRVLVKLKPGADATRIKGEIEKLTHKVQRVDVTRALVAKALDNVILSGPRHIEELAAVFANLVATLGVFLVVTTQLQTRWKELSLMAVRGFSERQLSVSLLVETLGMGAVALVLGLGIGFLNLSGQSQLISSTVSAIVEWKLVLTPASFGSMGAVVLLMTVATVVPIMVAVKRISENPILESE